jgi:predicted dehydrogenase
MRIGIIGYGIAGRIFHAPLIRLTGDAEIAGIVTRDPDRRAQAAADNPGARCFDRVEDLLHSDSIDLAVVACSTAEHSRVARTCIDAGIPVVVDKPLAVDSSDAQNLVEAAATARVPLTVFQNRRWDSDLLTLRRLIEAGELGDVLRFESRFERWRPALTAGKWREEMPPAKGGGVLLDLGSHLVDQALTLFGPVRSVYAEVEFRRGGGGDDDTFLALEHDHRIFSHLWCSSVAGSSGPRLRVLGTQGAFVVEDPDQQEAALREGRSPDQAKTPNGRIFRGTEVRHVQATPGSWTDFYPAVFASLRGDGPMPVDPRDAVSTLRVLDAALKSATQRSVIQL